jgi:hypothetical protein
MNNIVETGKLVTFEGKKYSVLRLHKGIGTSEVKAVLHGEDGQTIEVLKRVLEADTSMNKKVELTIKPVLEEKIKEINYVDKNDIKEVEEEPQNNSFFNKNVNKSTRKNKK